MIALSSIFGLKRYRTRQEPEDYEMIQKNPIPWTMPILVALALALSVVFAVGDAKAGKSEVFTGLVKGVAVGGYDPVAYFDGGKPAKGSPEITLEHNGAIWRFATDASRKAFEADPAKYAPQYGGYCAWAVSRGYTAKGDPNAWRIVDGKLYLNYNKDVQRTWSKNIAANVAKANANWPKVLSK